MGSYYINHFNHRFHDQARILRFGTDRSEWEEDIRLIWEDLAEPGIAIDIVIVRPTPPFFAFRGTAATVIVQQRPQPDRVACLTTAVLPLSPDLRVIEAAHSVPSIMEYRAIIQLSGVEHVCLHREQQGFGPCALMVGLFPLDPAHEVHLHPGIGFTVRVPPPLNEEEAEHNVGLRNSERDGAPERTPTQEPEDTVSFMARQHRPAVSSSSSLSRGSTSTSRSEASTNAMDEHGGDIDTVNLRQTVVFPTTGAPRSLFLPWNDGRAMYGNIEEAFEITSSDIYDVHHVRHRPHDLEIQHLQGLLLQKITDLRPSTFMRLILVDLETYEDDLLQPSAFQRFTKWIPHTINRRSVFRMLNIEEIAEQYSAQTKLWHNNRLIVPDQTEPLQVCDGDYIKVFIGDSACADISLSDIELPDFPSSLEQEWDTMRADQVELLQTFSKVSMTLSEDVGPRTDFFIQHRVSQGQGLGPGNVFQCEEEPPPGREPPRHVHWPLDHRADIRRLWDESILTTTTEAGDRVVPFATWFLSGQGFHRCEAPRIAWLPRESAAWNAILSRTWHEFLDRRHPYRIVLVQPKGEACDQAGHLLLLQHEYPGERGALVSTFWHEETSAFDGRFARLLPRSLSFRRLLRYADLDRHCNEHNLLCVGYHGSIHIDGAASLQPQTGDHFEIHATPWDYIDGLNLMQESITMKRLRTHALEEHQPGEGEGQGFCFNPRAIAFNPSLPPLSDQTSFTQELFDLWQQEAFSWENEERNTKVVTYFVDHHDLFPRCDAGRLVILWENYADWEDSIKRVWRDKVRPGQSLDFFLVSPMPPQLEQGIAAYVLIVQSRRAELATSLISVFGTNGRLQGRSAITTFEQVYSFHFIYALGLQMLCLGQDPALQCTFNLRGHDLAPNQLAACRCGESIVASLRYQTAVVYRPVRANILLQRQVTIDHGPSREWPQGPDGSTAVEPHFALSPATCAQRSPSFHDEPKDFVEGHAREATFLESSDATDPQQHFWTPPVATLPQWWSELWHQFGTEAIAENIDEGPVLYVLTWFLHGNRQRYCDVPRVLRLDQHYQHWWEDIKELWRDSLDMTVPALVGLVWPSPPTGPYRYHQANLIIHQETNEEPTCILTTLFHGIHRQAFGQRAAIVRPHLTVDEIIHHANIYNQCAADLRSCVVEYGEQHFRQDSPPVFLHEYSSVVLHVDHPAFRLSESRMHVAVPEDDEVVLLQTDPRRLTGRTVAHTCRPLADQKPRTIALEELLPVQTFCIASECGCDEADQSQTSTMAYLTAGHDDLHIPAHVEVPMPGTPEQVSFELIAWGHHCKVIQFGGHDHYVCFHIQWCPPDQNIHYVYGSEDGRDPDMKFLHTSINGPLGIKDHMRLLHQRGCTKAAVLEDTAVWKNIRRVVFVCHQAELPPSSQIRISTPWPEKQPTATRQDMPFSASSFPSQPDASCISPGCTLQELEDFFSSGNGILCPDLDLSDLPESTQQALSQCGQVTRVDRLVVFTDGSSVGGLRHQPPILTDEQGHPDSWAFLVLAEQYMEEGASIIQFLGWQAQPVRYDPESPAYLGTSHTGSDAAEREAMFWASFWRLTTNSFIPTVFCSDSHTTCHQTIGQMGAQQYDDTFRCLRGVHQALAAFMPAEMLQVRHVRGHADDPWNDLADHLAKRVRTKGYYLPRHPTSLHKWKPLMPFLWMFLSSDSGLPPLCQEGFNAIAPDLPSLALPAESPSGEGKQRQLRMTLSMATANVQSLQRQGPDQCGHTGKIQYLREQFKAHGLQVLGIQEARTTQMCGMSDNVLRISSGHCKGLYGTELWFNMDRPYGYDGHRALCFAKHHFVVLHAGPKILIVRAQADYLCAVFVTAHAPHSGHSRQDREQWWQQLSKCITECGLRPEEKLYVMMDANATSGVCDNQHVGPHDDHVTASTGFLREFLDRHDLCLPGTFPIHEGHGETWTTPDGCHSSRIDYVAVPIDQGDQCTYSAVLDSLDLGTAAQDHTAVGLQLEWVCQTLTSKHKPPQGSCFERDQITRGSLTASIRDYMVPSWSCDIESHVQQYNKAMLSCLAEQCPRRKMGPKKSYITEEIWTMRSQKLTVKSRLKETRARSRQHLLQLCFQMWKGAPAADSASVTSWQFHTTLLCRNISLYAQFHFCTLKLKRALASARLQHLKSLIAALPSEASAGQILKVVKQIAGPTNPKKQITAVFPAIRQEDGSIAATPQQAADRWIQFFGDMEGGERCQPDSLRSIWRDNLAKFRQQSVTMALHELPSLCDLERAFARVAGGKAIGQDGLPPELCRTHAAELAKVSYSQLLKLALHGQEDLSHKGGYLVPAWKGKGAKDICSSYRSLLISSHQGKALHRALRQHHSGLYEQWLQTQQIGGRSHIPVGMGIHMVRSFLRIDCQRGCSIGVLFLDLREAFYRVLRPLALNAAWTDEELAVIVQRLKLPAGTLHELHRHLQEPCALEQAGLPGYIQNYVTAIHTDTWFQMRNQQDLVRTTIGSRPGDCYADVVFGFLWSRVLKEVERDLHASAALEEFPILRGLQLYDSEAAPSSTRPFLGPNWMDDLAVCVCLPALAINWLTKLDPWSAHCLRAAATMA